MQMQMLMRMMKMVSDDDAAAVVVGEKQLNDDGVAVMHDKSVAGHEVMLSDDDFVSVIREMM